MKIFHKEEIQKLLSLQTVLDYIEEGFVIFSKREAVIPHDAVMYFDKPPGGCHVKCGYAKYGKYFAIEVASAFFENPLKGLPFRNGLMLLFDKETGQVVCVLLDEGYLTDLRTGAAGCVAAMYLAPRNVGGIGVIGAGKQAHFQLRMLQFATSCRKVKIWGRDLAKAQKLAEHGDFKSFQIEAVENLDELTDSCNLIVTTTSSREPFLFADKIRKGTHITAIGADTPFKKELDPQIFTKADRIVVDSLEECSSIGDCSIALKKGLIKEEQIVELGNVILNPSLRRTSDDQITVVVLTGLAALDLQIAIAAYERLAP